MIQLLWLVRSGRLRGSKGRGSQAVVPITIDDEGIEELEENALTQLDNFIVEGQGLCERGCQPQGRTNSI